MRIVDSLLWAIITNRKKVFYRSSWLDFNREKKTLVKEIALKPLKLFSIPLHRTFKDYSNSFLIFVIDGFSQCALLLIVDVNDEVFS